MSYWLMKSEPDVFGLDHLKKEKKRTTHWDGVRNYQARNMMRDQMKVGDEAFFYHSSCAQPGIVGIVKITREGYVDHTAFDPDDPHFDPKSDPANPRWFMVDVTFSRKLKRFIALSELREHAHDGLEGFRLLSRGNRLSIMPVEEDHWKFILALE